MLHSTPRTCACVLHGSMCLSMPMPTRTALPRNVRTGDPPRQPSEASSVGTAPGWPARAQCRPGCPVSFLACPWSRLSLRVSMHRPRSSPISPQQRLPATSPRSQHPRQAEQIELRASPNWPHAAQLLSAGRQSGPRWAKRGLGPNLTLELSAHTSRPHMMSGQR